MVARAGRLPSSTYSESQETALPLQGGQRACHHLPRMVPPSTVLIVLTRRGRRTRRIALSCAILRRELPAPRQVYEERP